MNAIPENFPLPNGTAKIAQNLMLTGVFVSPTAQSSNELPPPLPPKMIHPEKGTGSAALPSLPLHELLPN